MATSDSRFKPFKLNSYSKPPPLPPKDLIYLERNNPSISSIDVLPNSPISPPPLHPSTSPSDRISTRRGGALAFLKFPKRSPRSPTGTGDGSINGHDDLENPPPPEPDSQISTPWNFQHNIHVNEGYIGLPPSWSTSLATVGFTPEEIADIQARRATGSLAPLDLRYLYTERPTTPVVAGFQSGAVPILSNPTSGTPLPLTESARPPVPKLVTSPSITRRPPPKRKPPLPTEELSQNGHKPNQASTSTTHQSCDSHQSNPTTSSSHDDQSVAFSGVNSSTSHYYPNPSTFTSNPPSHSGHSTTDDEGRTPLARAPLCLGPSGSNDPLSHSTLAAQTNSGPSTRLLKTAANSPSEFGVTHKLEEGESERPRTGDRSIIPKPIWGIKRTGTPVTGAVSSPSLSSLTSSVKSPSSSAAPLYLQQQQMSQSASNSSPFVAAASSSLSTLKVAAASTSLSIAAAMRNTKGVLRRGLGTSKDNDSESAENQEDEDFSDALEIDGTSGADGDDDLSVPAGYGGKQAVWQLYTRPRTSTDVNQQPPINTTNITGSGGKSYQSILPFSKSQGSLRSLTRRKPVIKKSDSQVSLNTQGSVSQVSLDSVSAAASGSGNMSGLTGDTKYIKKHQYSGSVTSLQSIPETGATAGLPSHPYAMAPNYAPSSSFTASSKKPSATPVRPPFLTLQHQSKGSLDLSMWSEALLSGISKSTDLDLAFTFSEGEKGTAEGRKGRWKGKGRDSWDGEGVTENAVGLKETEKEKDDKEPGSSLATARPLGYPTQTINMNQNASAIAAGPSQRQQAIPTKPRHLVPARPVPPIIVSNNGSSSTSTLVEKPPLYSTSRSRSSSRSKQSSPTAPPPSAILSPLPRPPNGTIAHPHHHHGYGQSPKPPPAVPLPPPPSAVPNVSVYTSNNTTVTPPAMTVRGILPLPPTSAAALSATSMLSPPTSAFPPQSLKSPTSSTGPDSAQLWSEIETMMNPGLMQKMGLTGAGVDMGASGVVLGLPPVGMKGSVKTVGGAGGELVLDQSQVQVPHFPTADSDLDVGTPTTGLIISTVGDLVGSSPDTSAALTERFSPILPFSPEEERMATTRVLRAGEGVLGTKTHSQGEEEKNVEEGGDKCGSGYVDLRDREEEEGSNASDYSDREESVVHPSKAPGSTDGLLVPDDHFNQRSREALPARDQANRDSSRSSSSTSTTEAVAVAATTTVVRKVSIARRAGAVVLKGANVNPALLAPATSNSNGGMRPTNSLSPLSAVPIDSRYAPSLSSNFENSSEESAGSLSHSHSPSSPSQDNYPTPGTDSASLTSPLMYYLDGTQTPSPLPENMTFGPFPPLLPTTATTPQPSRTKAPNEGDITNYYSPGDDDEDGVPFAYPDEAMVEVVRASMAAAASAVPASRPTIVISDEPLSAAMPTATTTNSASLSPFQQYRGWLSAIVAPLEEFIDEGVDPRKHYLDLTEIAEGESGSVFSARLNPLTASKLRLPPMIKDKDAAEMSQHPEQVKLVAIKSVAIVPSGSPKLVDLRKELMLMKGLVGHENVLGMDGVYVDLVEDSLWVRMELMERSLADMVGLVGDGLMLQDRMLARFASDVLSALEYLQKYSIAHRDVRSDNLLLNKHGFLKLADFSNAVKVTKDAPMRTDPTGVVYWQAPEVRKPPYNALKVDVWSLGATVWEMAQTEPPFYSTQQFGDRWPPLRQPELYSPAFHDFLRKCSEPALSRPNPNDLLKHPFVQNACGRPVIVHLLSQCMAIEQSLSEGPNASP